MLAAGAGGAVALSSDDAALRVVHRGSDFNLAGRTMRSTLKVPGAREITVKTTTGESAPSSDSKRRKAPRGGRLLAVKWMLTNRLDGLTADPQTDPKVTPVRPISVAVRVGGTTVPVATVTAPGEDSALLEIPGSGDDVEIVVGYLGRSQSVQMSSGRRTAGAFAPLYRSSRPDRSLRQTGTYKARRDADLRWYGQSKYTSQRAPFVEGLGWAPAGAEWVIVRRPQVALLNKPRFSTAGSDATSQYAARATTGSAMTVNGRSAKRSWPAKGSPDVFSYGPVVFDPGSLAFQIELGAAYDVRVRVAMTLTREPSKRAAGPATASITYDVRTAYAPVSAPGAGS